MPSLLIDVSLQLTIPTEVVVPVHSLTGDTNMRAFICLPDSIARLEVTLGVFGKLKLFDTLVCKKTVNDRVSVSGIRGGWGYRVQELVARWLKTLNSTKHFYCSIYSVFSSS